MNNRLVLQPGWLSWPKVYYRFSVYKAKRLRTLGSTKLRFLMEVSVEIEVSKQR
jgi:hypothetical protein